MSTLLVFSLLVGLSMGTLTGATGSARDGGPDRAAARELSGLVVRTARRSTAADEYTPRVMPLAEIATVADGSGVGAWAIARASDGRAAWDPASVVRRGLLNLPPPRA